MSGRPISTTTSIWADRRSDHSSAGSSFSATATTNGASLTYDRTHVRGLYSAKHVLTSRSDSYYQWSGARTVWFGHIYVWFDSLPSGDLRLVRAASGGALRLAIDVLNTGILRAMDQQNSQIVSTTSAIATRRWIRIEFKVDHTTGTVQLRLFNTTTSTTPTQVVTSAAGEVDRLQCGSIPVRSLRQPVVRRHVLDRRSRDGGNRIPRALRADFLSTGLLIDDDIVEVHRHRAGAVRRADGDPSDDRATRVRRPRAEDRRPVLVEGPGAAGRRRSRITPGSSRRPWAERPRLRSESPRHRSATGGRAPNSTASLTIGASPAVRKRSRLPPPTVEVRLTCGQVRAGSGIRVRHGASRRSPAGAAHPQREPAPAARPSRPAAGTISSGTAGGSARLPFRRRLPAVDSAAPPVLDRPMSAPSRTGGPKSCAWLMTTGRRDDHVERRLELAAQRRPDVGERPVLRLGLADLDVDRQVRLVERAAEVARA